MEDYDDLTQACVSCEHSEHIFKCAEFVDRTEYERVKGWYYCNLDKCPVILKTNCINYQGDYPF